MALITRITLRNDSTANWQINSSAVLLKGEVGVEFPDIGAPKLKVGDGVSTWENLPYVGAMSDSSITSVDENAFTVNESNILTLLGF